MAKPLSVAKVRTALAGLPGWSHRRHALVKSFEFEDFRQALSFMVCAGFEAEGMNHHPEWTNVYNRVSIRLNTHDAGNRVTLKDVELATRIERILASQG